ncbi:MAG: transporter substrate-binding domain-containing protein [Venatoribacter sp.]
MLKKLFALWGLLLVMGGAYADLPVRVVAFSVPFLLSENAEGPFADLLRLAAQEQGLTLELEVLPASRARLKFAQEQADILLPGVRSAMISPHLASTPFYNKDIIAFTNLNELVTRTEQLKNKVIGIVRGYSYPNFLLNVNGANYVSVTSDKQLIQMLLTGRIEIAFIERLAGVRILENLQQENNPSYQAKINFDLNNPFSVDPVYFAFQPTKQGKELQQLFEQALSKIRSEKRLPEFVF